MKKLLGLLLFIAVPATAQSTYPLQPGGGLAAGGGAITGAITGATGCTTPPFSFTVDTDAGLCATAANAVNVQTGTGTISVSKLEFGSNFAYLNFYDGVGMDSGVRAFDNTLQLWSAGTVRVAIGGAATTTGNTTGGPAGTVAAPTYSFSADDDTGIFRGAGANELAFAVGGAFIAQLQAGTFRPGFTGTTALGSSSFFWEDLFLVESTQGGRVKNLTESVATSFVRIGTNSVSGGEVIWTVQASDGAANQSLQGRTRFAGASAVFDTDICTVTSVGTDTLAASSGTLSCTITCLDVASGYALQANCVSSLAQVFFDITYRVDVPRAETITPL